MDDHSGYAAQLEWTGAKSCWTRTSADAVSWLPTLTLLNLEPFQGICASAANGPLITLTISGLMATSHEISHTTRQTTPLSLACGATRGRRVARGGEEVKYLTARPCVPG